MPKKAINIDKFTPQEQMAMRMTPDQVEAINKWRGDFRKVAPQIAQMGQVAQQVYQDTINAPGWRIAETENVNNAEPPEVWSVGHAKVNYVDKIKHRGHDLRASVDSESEGVEDK